MNKWFGNFYLQFINTNSNSLPHYSEVVQEPPYCATCYAYATLVLRAINERARAREILWDCTTSSASNLHFGPRGYEVFGGALETRQIRNETPCTNLFGNIFYSRRKNFRPEFETAIFRRWTIATSFAKIAMCTFGLRFQDRKWVEK